MTRIAASLALTLLAFAGCAPDGAGLLGGSHDYAGPWSGEVTSGDSVYTLDAELVQDKSVLTGTIVLDDGQRVWTFDAVGKVDRDELWLSGDHVDGASTISLALLDLEGALEGDWSMDVRTADYDAEDDSAYARDGDAILVPAVDAGE